MIQSLIPYSGKIWRALNLAISAKTPCSVHVYVYTCGSQDLFWRFFPRPPNHQIKTPANFSHYTVFTVHSLILWLLFVGSRWLSFNCPPYIFTYITLIYELAASILTFCVHPLLIISSIYSTHHHLATSF